MSGRILARAMMAAACVSSGGSLLLLVAKPLGSYLQFFWPATEALLWDTGLSLLFFAQHSIMVRPFFRRSLGIARHYWGAVFATASGLVLAAAIVLWQRVGTVLIDIPGPVRVVAVVGQVLMLAVFVSGIAVLRATDLVGIKPLRAHLRGEAPQPVPFVVNGPYRWVRHPLYSAVIVLIWLDPAVTADRLLFNILWTLWIVVAARWEEADLAREFGEPYRRYQHQVPMLVPWRGAAMART